jgi:hypothetical protein
MFATPSGYLVDERGIIAADVAIGGDAILELVDGSREIRERIEARIATLRREYDVGQAKLQQLERESISMRETVLRISGAILVLEEFLPPSASVTPISVHQ